MRRAFAVLATCAAALSHAQSAAPARWYLQVDNDFFFDTDRWYSSGVRIARVAGTPGEATEWALVQEIYTPEGKHFELGTVDRAPTARLGGRFAWHRQDDDVFQTIELGLGVRGRGAYGEETTRAIHHVFRAAPVDWAREVPSEVDASAAITRTHAIGGFAFHYGATLGNEVAYAHGGVEWRTGSARNVYSPVLRMAATPPFSVGGAQATGWGGFIGANVRAVARNQLLDLSYDPETVAPDRNTWVARVAGGLTAQQSWGELVFTLAAESREFAQQRIAQRFGSIVLHIPF